MNKLNELAKKYKETNSQTILLEIFKLLERTINDKAKYVFYRQEFIKDKYNIKLWDKDKNKLKKVERVKTFRLCETKKIELDDIKQDLKLLIIELLNKFDLKKPFENYFNVTLKYWRPTYIQNKNFIRELDTINESQLIKDNEDESPLNGLALAEPEYPQEPTDMEEMFKNLTDKEKRLIELMLQFPEKNHLQLAEMIGVGRTAVTEMIRGLRKKVK